MDAKSEIRESISKKDMRYVHFDSRIKLNDIVWNHITDASWVLKHSFYPFLHFKRPKFHKEWKTDSCGKRIGKETVKSRDIMYAAHIDAWIYRYYGAIFNHYYNEYLDKKGMDAIPIAYRMNKRGQSSITFAEEALAFIKCNKPCFVMIGDFTHFFDFLDHRYLLDQVRAVLGQEYICDDVYYVLRTLLKYSYVDYDAIVSYKGIPHEELEKCVTILSDEEFRKLSRKRKRGSKDDQYIIKTNRNKWGIPQGASMSGVLANMYMVQFDEQIYHKVQECHGLYRRYSDDFIIVLPRKYIDEVQYTNFHKQLKELFQKKSEATGEYLVKLSPEKTKQYQMTENFEIFDDKMEKGIISFLGFSYDGKRVYIKDSTVRRYYRHAYYKADTIARQNARLQGKKRSHKNLYMLYSIPGFDRHADKKRQISNFPLYSRKADKLFRKNFKDENRTGLVAMRHMRQLKRRFNRRKRQ